MRLAIILPAEVSWKTTRSSLCGVVVRCSRVEPKLQGSNPTEFYIPSFFFFSVYCVVVFFKYIAK